jgi:hypothetical protein
VSLFYGPCFGRTIISNFNARRRQAYLR